MKRTRGYWLGLLVLVLITSFIYFISQVETIYGGDAGDLVSAILTLGIPHPPGYPLYTFLGIILVKIIPFGTPAYRVGFLSSIPAILSVIFLYEVFYLLFRRVFPTFVSMLTLVFLYPIWLYASVVEVFALNNLFTILLLLFCLRFFLKGEKKDFYLGSFFFGLSLTHHHIILFLLPGIIYLLLKKKKAISSRLLLKSFFLFFLGLLPYLYVLFASAFNPPLNWQGPPNFVNFFNLVTRAGYGTFRAGAFIAHEPILRFFDVYAFFDFVYKDFRLLGIILFFFGVVYLYQNRKEIFFFLSLLFSSYLFFLFYASFPLVDNFLVGTFERFIQPLYIFLSFYLGAGIIFFLKIFEKILKQFFSFSKLKKVLFLTNALFVIYPLGIFFLNFPKINSLKNDFTAENLALDILSSIPEESILIISTDTPLFNTQYLYYWQKKWPKVKLIHLAKMYLPYYFDQLKKYYPDLELPETNGTSKEQFELFLKKNYKRFPIFSKVAFVTEEGVFVPWGLLFRYYEKNDVPSKEYLYQENKRLFSLYHNPLSGSLKKYQNLLLSDVLRIYAFSHQEIGFWQAKHGYLKEAEKHLKEAQLLYPEDLDSYTILAQVYLLQNRCQEAQEQIETRIKKEKDDPGSYYLQSLNYAVCFKDKEKASYYEKLFEEKKRGKETELKKL